MSNASQHRRHSSADTLGWVYRSRARDESPPAAVDRSISSRVLSFSREVFPALKRQSSTCSSCSGEYLASCFGSRGEESQRPILSIYTSVNAGDGRAAATERGAGRPPRVRSISLGCFELDFGSMRFKDKRHDECRSTLAKRAGELNLLAATHKYRVLEPGGSWVLEDDADHYLKPPAWKQALLKLRAEAKRHVVHPFPARDCGPLGYDLKDYEKNFDDGGRAALYMVVDEEADEFGVKARIRHSQLLTRLHSQRLQADCGPSKLRTAASAPVVLPLEPVKAPRPRVDAAPIWERRGAARPITKLQLTRSI